MEDGEREKLLLKLADVPHHPAGDWKLKPPEFFTQCNAPARWNSFVIAARVTHSEFATPKLQVSQFRAARPISTARLTDRTDPTTYKISRQLLHIQKQ